MSDNKGRRLFNNRAREDRPHNTTFNVDLFELSKTHKFDYDRDTLLDILEDIPFDLISIPVYAHKSLIINEDARGTMIVGYVKDFDAKNEKFTVVIYGNYVDVVSNFLDAVIFPRVFVNKDSGVVNSIIGLDISPKEEYKDLFN